ncbi:Thioredoxin [Rosistilla ulvae]|uniref:Thioredoxin n=1 Tax=Rosistilla ulvae TaxID=1930277 RepID=A0A517LXN1_9BACT|nr:thioredoxin family protein [Rosistilla ulvae]QDS87369.1 Thioredoxin [Rosistilla ulvae]
MNKIMGIGLLALIVYYGYNHYSSDGLAGITGGYSDAAFEKQIEGPGLVIVKFGAPWCGPCRMIDEQLEHVTGNVEVVKINIDRNRELASKFKVSGIPHTVIFRDGKPLGQFTGYRDAKAISSWARQFGSEVAPVQNASSGGSALQPNGIKTNPYAT